MLTPHIIATLENTLCRLVRMGKDVNGVRNELRQLIDQCRTLAPPMPTEEQERAEVRHRLDAFDGHLRELNKGMLRLRDAQREQVESEKKLPGNIMAGHGIDIKLAYVLAEDDPAFAEDADNILTERGGESNPSGGETIAEREFNIETENCPPASPVMSRQCWYVHDLTDHDMGPGQRRLGTMELLCIGHVWIDAVTTRQFCLNLRTGEYETALRISKGNNGMPMRCDETGGELYLHPFKTRYCYQFSHLEGSMLDPRDWQWFVLEQLFSDIDTTLGSDRRGFHWLQIEMKFNKTRLDARMDGQLLSRIFAEDIKDIQSRYRTTDQTLECVRQLIRIAEHQLAQTLNIRNAKLIIAGCVKSKGNCSSRCM